MTHGSGRKESLPKGRVASAGGEMLRKLRFYVIANIGDEETEAALVCDVDLIAANDYRMAWNLFRDRRPEVYGEILTLDGVT